MATVLIILILVVVAVISVKSYRKKLASGCCGSSSEAAIKKVRVKDKDVAHYPFVRLLYIDGMSCNNCAARVENSLNSHEGVWAEAKWEKGEALVRMKNKLTDEKLKEIVSEAGYKVYKVSPPPDN